ncbi:HTTM domain-containing protein [Roseivirga sp.]|uniref:HTTM domain-containing protein n=1 Tax=Roseivirga sp. TaxID=1964215 RepID=UPI003B8D600D
MTTIEGIYSAWQTFFFEPQEGYTIALFRIGFGIILLREAFYIMANLEEYLGPNGLVGYDRYYSRSRKVTFSLFLYFPPTMRSVKGIMILHFLGIVGMILGFLTPLCIAVTFITTRSIVNRNPSICNGGDNVSRIMLFYLIFANAGHVYSLDEILFYNADSSGISHTLVSPWAIRLMQIQFSIIYLNTTYWKMKGTTYREGTAVYYAMNNHIYSRGRIPVWFIQKPMVFVLTWGALAVEFFLGFGVWIEELRPATVIAGMGLHCVMEYMMNVHLFGWYMITCWILFIDPITISNFFNSIII